MLTPTDVMSCLAQVQRQMMDIPLERTVNVQSLYAVHNWQLLCVVFYPKMSVELYKYQTHVYITPIFQKGEGAIQKL